MRLTVSTLALMVVAMMVVGSAQAKPTEMEGKMSPEMYKMLTQQICSSKTIPDCHRKTKECFSLMDSTPGTSSCPGLSTTDCLQKLMECSELLSMDDGGSPEPEPESHGEGPPGHGPTDSGPPGHGPQGSGPPGHGPQGSGPPGHGPQGSGPPGHGPQGSGPPGHGPQGSGPPGHGPQGSGPPGHGPQGNGPAGHGSQENGPSGHGPQGSGPPGHGSMMGGMAGTMKQQAEIMCSLSEDPTCREEVMDCLMFAEELMEGSSEETTKPHHSMCEGVDIANCKTKITTCDEKLQALANIMGSSAGNGNTPHGETSMNEGPHMPPEQTAMIMCTVSEDPDCMQKVVSCLVMSKNMAESSKMSGHPDPNICGSTDMSDCMTKMMMCNELMDGLSEQMGSMQSGEMMSDMIKDDSTSPVKIRDGRKRNRKNERENGSDTQEKREGGRTGGRKGGRRNKHKGDERPQRPNHDKSQESDDFSDDDSDDDDISDDESLETGTGGRRRKRDTHETKHERYEEEEDHEDGSYEEKDDYEDEIPGRPLASLDIFIMQVDEMMRHIDEMMMQFAVIMGIMDTVMDEKTPVMGTRPGVLPLREKAMYLNKYMCNHEDNSTDCAFMTEECAVWLAPSPNLPIVNGMEDNCSEIVPPPSSVADTCMDFSTEECRKEAVSCMNLLIATGGTSGYAGPLTPHSHQCEEMMMRMISSQSCSGKDNATECEMSISVCMDTIRVKTDELHDHHFPEKLMCEPVMRPATALYMCSYRDEPDCFSRMHKCLVNMAPEAGDMKGMDTREMMGCLKLTRPPVGAICGPDEDQGCTEKYDTCSNLIHPNAEFLKAAQGCMGRADEMDAKTCLQPALNEMTKSIENEPVQIGIKDLYQNFWTPSMGIVGFHSCMMMVCTIEISP
ncbi:uncharacterized protein [Palaemon carinicauda]|uniref:uncharacterized protein n=1 Tax=Palaemon carinicauda TaxID=392227 RepID=UPI0035B5F4D8